MSRQYSTLSSDDPMGIHPCCTFFMHKTDSMGHMPKASACSIRAAWLCFELHKRKHLLRKTCVIQFMFVWRTFLNPKWLLFCDWPGCAHQVPAHQAPSHIVNFAANIADLGINMFVDLAQHVLPATKFSNVCATDSCCLAATIESEKHCNEHATRWMPS